MDKVVQMLQEAKRLLEEVDKGLQKLPKNQSERRTKLRESLCQKQVITLRNIIKVCAVLEVRPGDDSYPACNVKKFKIGPALWAGMCIEGGEDHLDVVSFGPRAEERWSAEECVTKGYYSQISTRLFEEAEEAIKALKVGSEETQNQGQKLAEFGRLLLQVNN